MLYLPRQGKFHWSDYTTYKSSKATYFKRFFDGQDNLRTKAIQFGSEFMRLMEFEPENPLVADIPRHPYIEYGLECMLGGVVPILTHPDSIDIDNTLGIYEYKTALGHQAWTSRLVYKQQQISFYQTCVRELKGKYNPDDNFIVEIRTERVSTETIDGVEWQSVEAGKYQEVRRATTESGDYIPPLLHRRTVTPLEMDRLKDDVIATALEVSGHYKKYLDDLYESI